MEEGDSNGSKPVLRALVFGNDLQKALKRAGVLNSVSGPYGSTGGREFIFKVEVVEEGKGKCHSFEKVFSNGPGKYRLGVSFGRRRDLFIPAEEYWLKAAPKVGIRHPVVQEIEIAVCFDQT